jgi:hypothetical protein
MTVFWLIVALLILDIVFMIWCVAGERPFFGFFSSMLTIVAFGWYFGWSLLELVIMNPALTVSLSFFYILTGIAWSLVKWGHFVGKIKDKYIAARKDWKTGESLYKDYDLAGFKFYFKRYWENQSIPPLASENKNRILTWMIYWPFSFLWTIIDEPFKKAFELLFNSIKRLYQWISDGIFEGVE